MTRKELEAVRNHISCIPTIGAMYAPVLVEWADILLRERDAARAEIERLRAEVAEVERERDAARAEVERLRNDLARFREVQRATAEGWRHEVAEVASIVGAPAHTAELAACVRAEIERLRVIIQEWSYPRLYVQPGVERETLLAQLQENLVNKVRPSIEAAEERGARWALERHGNPFAEKTLAQYAEEICRDARGKT